MPKPNIAMKQLPPWDQYKDRKPEDAIEAIYRRVGDTSSMMCQWYWTSIRTKRKTSLALRGLAFACLLFGTTLPICAAIQALDSDKLLLTQLAVALLAVAGLLMLADRVFGWSSGWMRYITTVTTMENLTRAFQLEWGRYLVAKTTPLDSADAKTLFELACGLEGELTRLQAEETTKWVAEFNTGISLLESLIKTQREETDKKLDAIRTTLASQQQAAKAEEKGRLAGAIEATIAHKGEVRKVRIALDNETPTDFAGSVWSRTSVAPGIHVLTVQTASEPPASIAKVVEVGAGSVARIEIKVPE